MVDKGVDALKLMHSYWPAGRISKLNTEQLANLDEDLKHSPTVFGYEFDNWDALLVSRHLKEHYLVDTQVRQCQRIMRRLGYTLQN